MTKSPEKDLYAILGVTSEATPQEIRDAYRARARIAHPDRFDPQSHADVWKQANEMLVELNGAYAVLGDAERRREYDELRASLFRRTQSESSPPKSAPFPSRSSSFEGGDLTSGQARFADLPKHVQDRLLARQEGRDEDQFQVPLASIVWNYIFTAALLCWFWYVYSDANRTQWKTSTLAWYGGLTLVVALLIGYNVVTVVQWARSSLKPYFYITPIYFIKTEYDIVTFRPIWELRDVGVTHNHRNGSYRDSDVVLKFDGHDESLSLSTKRLVEAMFGYMKDCDSRLRVAFQNGNHNYCRVHDDFAGVARSGVPTNVLVSAEVRFAIYVTAVVLSGLALFVAIGVNTELAATRWVHHPVPTPYTPPAPPPVLPPPVPAQSLPPNGTVKSFTSAEPLAPFEIKADQGSHYLLKLVDAETRSPVLSVFVHSDTTINIDVPLGTYEVRYASGEVWYGDEYLFGPDTAYSKADAPFTFEIVGNHVRGFTVTLYSVLNGNLSTSPIDAAEF